MESEVYSRVVYQTLLRAVGAYFDDRSAGRVSVMEEPNGFILRYGQRDENQTECTQLGWGTLVRLSMELEARRRDTGHQAGGAEQQASYQDLFRAIGRELDDVGAKGVVLAEADEVLVVRYIYVHDASGRIREARVAEIHPGDGQLLLEEARARRHPHSADCSLTSSLGASTRVRR
jgi:hypothetical protein